MTDAGDLTLALGGTWERRCGAAPCPVCKPERLKAGGDRRRIVDFIAMRLE